MNDNITQDLELVRNLIGFFTKLLLLCVIEGSHNFVDLFLKILQLASFLLIFC